MHVGRVGYHLSGLKDGNIRTECDTRVGGWQAIIFQGRLTLNNFNCSHLYEYLPLLDYELERYHIVFLRHYAVFFTSVKCVSIRPAEVIGVSMFFFPLVRDGVATRAVNRMGEGAVTY